MYILIPEKGRTNGLAFFYEFVFQNGLQRLLLESSGNRYFKFTNPQHVSFNGVDSSNIYYKRFMYLNKTI